MATLGRLRFICQDYSFHQVFLGSDRLGGMHLVPADRAHRRVIDHDKVCEAIESIADPVAVPIWSERFTLLGDPTRLRVLLCIRAAGPISVSDLAAAVDLNADAVSQLLRFLRASHTVTAQRERENCPLSTR